MYLLVNLLSNFTSSESIIKQCKFLMIIINIKDILLSEMMLAVKILQKLSVI